MTKETDLYSPYKRAPKTLTYQEMRIAIDRTHLTYLYFPFLLWISGGLWLRIEKYKGNIGRYVT